MAPIVPCLLGVMVLSVAVSTVPLLSTGLHLRRSDVILSSRWVHYQPVGGPPSLDTWEAVAAFNASRIDWCYTANSSFIRAALQRGLSGVGLATNANNPDDGDDRCNVQDHPHSCSWSVGRVLNIKGYPLASPPAVFRPVAHGCVNSPDYMNITLQFVDNLKAAGAKAIQHDDAAMNNEATRWNSGNLSSSGCYCSHCMTKFTATLMQNRFGASPALRAAYNITSQWSYRTWLLQRPISDADSAPDHSPLRDLFLAFQQRSTEDYVRTLRRHLNRSAPAITLSANNGGSWNSPYQLFDYGIGELELNIGTQMTLLRRLHALFVADLPRGKHQVMTMPKGLNLKAWYTMEATALIRAAIAVSYALGGHMLAPWDAEIPGGRYYGNASQFADLFGFVRRHARVFDAVVVKLRTEWLPRVLTERSAPNFREQPPLSSVARLATVPAGLRECQSLCDRVARRNSSACVGVQLQDRLNTQPASVGECALFAGSPTRLWPPLQPTSSAVQEVLPAGLRWYRRLSEPRRSTVSSEFHSVALKVSDPQTLTVGWDGRIRNTVDGVEIGGPVLVFHLVNARPLAEVGCCPSVFKPSFAFHVKNCTGNNLSCCRCSETPRPTPLPPSLDVFLTRLVAGACPKNVEVMSVDEKVHAISPIKCDGEQAQFMISPSPTMWAILIVQFVD